MRQMLLLSICGLLLIASFFSTSISAQSQPSSSDAPPLKLWETKVISTHDSAHVHPARWFPTIFNGYPQGIKAQLDGGVRSLEFDLISKTFSPNDAERSTFRPINFPVIDDVSSCNPEMQCIAEVIEWSLQHPKHYPIIIILDPDVHPKYSHFRTPTDWYGFAAYVHKLFMKAPELLYSYSEFRRQFGVDPLVKLGDVPLQQLRGRIIVTLDAGENNAAPLAASGSLNPMMLPFWLFCRRRDIIYYDKPTSWCHFLKYWGMPSAAERWDQLWSGKSHYMSRVVVDYRLFQVPGLQAIANSATEPVIFKGTQVANSLDEWNIILFFNALDTNQDGYVNMMDSGMNELLTFFGYQRSISLFLIRQIGFPRFLCGFLYRTLTSMPSLKDDLRTYTDISEARQKAKMAEETCGQLLVTDFPSSLFGDLPYSFPVPKNGEFTLNPCMDPARMQKFATEMTTLTQHVGLSKSLLSKESWDKLSQPPELPGWGISTLFWCLYGLTWFVSAFGTVPYLLYRLWRWQVGQSRRGVSFLQGLQETSQTAKIGLCVIVTVALIVIYLEVVTWWNLSS